jgi:hypothetical protein
MKKESGKSFGAIVEKDGDSSIKKIKEAYKKEANSFLRFRSPLIIGIRS